MFLTVLGQQPLFRLLGAVIVLLITDMNTMYGVVAFAVWLVWIYVSRPSSPSNFFSGTH
jgi:hypothetical protein